jgi:putative ABC transport system permease protein
VPLYEAIRLAFAQIRVQKLKSFFTLLGVMIGVMFLITVVSIVTGMGNYMRDDLVGKLIAINSFELRRRPNINLGDVDASTLREYRRRPQLYRYEVDPVAAALAPGTLWAVESGSNVDVQSRYATPRPVQASTVSEGWFTIKRMGVTNGRLFTPQEYALGSTVIVIGQDVADHFFPNLNPVGRELRLGGVPYTVVGVAESQGSVFGISLDKFLIAPERSPLNRLVNPHGVIDAMIVQSATEAGMPDNMERARQVMRAQRHLHPWQPDNFALETSDSALAFWDKVKGYLVLAGVILPAFGLLVGAIVIMNIMLVAVSERTQEIGIRKSLGARRRDIMAQFLLESATLSMVGAIIGVGLGIGLAKGVALVSPLPAAVAPWSIALAVAIGAGVGIAAGAYPAGRASRLDPILAIRAE